ncbi:MAG: hypothetical protein ABWZ93_14595, partial [Xanthobacteraceae bacterium]
NGTPTLPTGFIPPCLPMNAAQPPSGPSWLHEIKHDGFRVSRDNLDENGSGNQGLKRRPVAKV